MNLTTLLILTFIVFANASPKSDDIKKRKYILFTFETAQIYLKIMKKEEHSLVGQ